MAVNTKAVIVGFECDEGVRRNGGRPGAAEAPEAIRKPLYAMTPDAEEHDLFVDFLDSCADAGNLTGTGDLDEDQHKLGEILAGCLNKGVVSVVLGGGHETAFGQFLGYAEAGYQTSVFNLDAHTDVRPLKDGQAHSGSPFRQMLGHESGAANTYLAAGLQPYAVARSHVDYIESEGGHCLFRDETNITSLSDLFHRHSSEHLMVTFDMDAVDQSQAPGVSAPCANGLPVDLWLMAAYLAGRNEQVSSFSLCEVNPAYDRDGQTARLAALTIWNFMLGLSQRE